ncbi:MAG: DUF3616 domain-containing protein [Gammaproteobacteria bacterium]|nr:DUF3616 domain-containing protein [Gammaproteobacteria bacterium]
MMIHLTSFLVLFYFLFHSTISAKELQAQAPVQLRGEIKAAEDLSGIAQLGPFLAIGSDEAASKRGAENVIQLLEKVSTDRYQVRHDIMLFKGNDKDGPEMDIEGLAADGEILYVIGSYSAKRKRVKKSRDYKANRKTFSAKGISHEKNRDWLYRLRIDGQGKTMERQRISLRHIIRHNGVLKTFQHLPSKENGIDIEGIAVRGKWLYLGFRSPVLRRNYVPVMKLKFTDPDQTHELLYLNLDGRGIRDITRVSDGFLIIAGPPGEGPASYQLYHWDGRDMVPGKDRAKKDTGKATLLGEICPPKNGKAEGITIVEEQTTTYEIIIVYDGIKNGSAQRFRVRKP